MIATRPTQLQLTDCADKYPLGHPHMANVSLQPVLFEHSGVHQLKL
jgi:hypothetical protein